MTREEAIKEIKDASDSEVRYGDIDNHYDKVMKRVEAFEMAIKALEQQLRDCKTCKHSDKGNCAGTGECHECMWESKYEQQSSEDCISREEAIRVAEQGQIQGYEWQFKKLCDLPSVTPQQTRWILVSERLPKESGRYIVTRGLNACGAMWNRVYIINYSDLMGLKSERIWWDGNVGKSDFKRIDDVIAWMPLPQQPYRESEK